MTRIAPTALYQEVAERLRQRIFAHELTPGTWIDEQKLAEQYGISRTPLREALKVLAMEGLVELIPGRGAMVSTLTVKDVHDMLGVLGALEQLAGTLTCLNASDSEIREVRKLHDEMLSFYHSGNRLQYFKKNQQIHAALIALTGNASLAMVHEMLQSRMRRIRYLGDQNDETWAGAVADHEEMITALEARDGEKLSAALVEHLSSTWDRVKDEI